MSPLLPEMKTCCMCGNSEPVVAYCGICQHNFCQICRKNLWWRGRAALKEMFLKEPPDHCKCKGD